RVLELQRGQNHGEARRWSGLRRCWLGRRCGLVVGHRFGVLLRWQRPAREPVLQAGVAELVGAAELATNAAAAIAAAGLPPVTSQVAAPSSAPRSAARDSPVRRSARRVRMGLPL